MTDTPKKHFLSYSRQEGEQFVKALLEGLKKDYLSDRIWIDVYSLEPGRPWRDQIQQAIKECESLLLVMTQHCLEDSYCKMEFHFAEIVKKPVVMILTQPEKVEKIGIGETHGIDFSTDFQTGLNQLKRYLRKSDSWEVKLDFIRRLMKGLTQKVEVRDITSKWPTIENTIGQLDEEIGELERILKKHKEGSQEPSHLQNKCKPVNDPPAQAPSYFQGRGEQLALCSKFIKDETKHVLLVWGRRGVGKTALVCHLLKSLENGQLLEDFGSWSVDGIVYLNLRGSHELSWHNFFSGVSNILDEIEGKKLETLYENPGITISEKTRKLLEILGQRRVVVFFDGLEVLLDLDTREFRDHEIEKAFQVIQEWPFCGLKIVLTSRVNPQKLNSERMELGGLPSPYAENVLHAMDSDGSLGLKTASENDLANVRELTCGNPEALEKLVGALREERSFSFKEVLARRQRVSSEDFIEALVGEIFEHLGTADKMVVQALAIFGRPISPIGINFILEPFLPCLDSEPTLRRLVNMKLVQKEAGNYFLHKIDQSYALDKVQKDQPSDREKTDPPEFTLFALRRRAAEFYKSIRKPVEECYSIEDLAPYLAEFDLRYEGQEFDLAAGILAEIRDVMLAWGHYGQIAECYERLRENLIDPAVKDSVLRALGWIYEKLGEIKKAISCYQDGLKVSSQLKDRKFEALYLSNLGVCYEELNDIPIATLHCEQALRIAHYQGDGAREAHTLNILGDCCLEVGMVKEALDYYQQSLTLARQGRRRQQETLVLVNLARLHTEIGNKSLAEQMLKQTLLIVDNLDYPLGKASALTFLAEQHIDNSEFHQGLSKYNEAILFADSIKAVQLQMIARIGQAIALLFHGKLREAFECSKTVCQYDHLRYNFVAYEVLGLTALRHGSISEAIEAFNKSLGMSQILLNRTYQNHRALDAKCIALCGLAICQDTDEFIRSAIDAFRTARTVSSNVGTVRKVIRVFDELAKEDQNRRLSGMRLEITGNV